MFEVIDEDTPRFVLRRRIQQYIEYDDSNEWTEATNHPFPNVLLLCPNDKMKQFLHKHITQVMEEEPDNDWNWFLATKDRYEWVNAVVEEDEN